MDGYARTYWLNVALNVIPDLAVCWAVMRLTDSSWTGYFITFAALQAIYFFFWLKTAVWSWLLFWIFRKEQLASHIQNFLIQNRFPVPDEFTTDYGDYVSQIANGEEWEPDIRVKSAVEVGTIVGFRSLQRFSILLQLSSAGALALKRYANWAQHVRR